MPQSQTGSIRSGSLLCKGFSPLPHCALSVQTDSRTVTASQERSRRKETLLSYCFHIPEVPEIWIKAGMPDRTVPGKLPLQVSRCRPLLFSVNSLFFLSCTSSSPFIPVVRFHPPGLSHHLRFSPHTDRGFSPSLYPFSWLFRPVHIPGSAHRIPSPGCTPRPSPPWSD